MVVAMRTWDSILYIVIGEYGRKSQFFDTSGAMQHSLSNWLHLLPLPLRICLDSASQLNETKVF